MEPRDSLPEALLERCQLRPGGRLKPQFRLWLAADDHPSSFGHGRWRLLAAIEREGSLRAAAATLGVSYRKAWGDLRKIENALGMRLIAPQRGGAGGGRTGLTDEGRRWLRAYDRFEAEVAAAVTRAYRTSFAELQP